MLDIRGLVHLEDVQSLKKVEFHRVGQFVA